MRIVSGKYRGKLIVPPAGFTARPTTDFAKENLFNIIAPNFDMEEVEALDLFSGTGSITYELVSRGCARVDLVELNAKHFAFIKKMVAELKMTQVHAVKNNAFTFLSFCTARYDLIFADPPYEIKGVEKIPDLVFERSLLKPDGWLIVEHSAGKDFSSHSRFWQHRKYGSVNFSFFK